MAAFSDSCVFRVANSVSQFFQPDSLYFSRGALQCCESALEERVSLWCVTALFWVEVTTSSLTNFPSGRTVCSTAEAAQEEQQGKQHGGKQGSSGESPGTIVSPSGAAATCLELLSFPWLMGWREGLLYF